jgi:diguanylate cyclase (GGDEF)-like protein
VPPPIVLDPRVAGAIGAAIVCGLLLLQYAHRRTPFILAWAAGWLLLAPAFLVTTVAYGSPRVAAVMAGVSQLLRICSAVLILWSADLYRGTGYVRSAWLQPLAVVALWFIAAPALFGPRTIDAPGYLANAILLLATAAMYAAVLVERRMLGAGLTAFVLLGLAIVNIAAAVALPRLLATSLGASQLFIVNVILAMLAVIGVHLLVFEDMTYELRMTNRRLEAAREDLVQLAITDPLTACYNRRFLDQVQAKELKRHARFDLPLSLLFVDVDNFKAVNDTLGHDTGDEVLRYVARFLKRHIREADYVFRWGGDEFLVLITCAEDEAQQKADALKAAFTAAPEAGRLPVGIGLSVGAVEVPADTADLRPLLTEADARMYKDKDKSRATTGRVTVPARSRPPKA